MSKDTTPLMRQYLGIKKNYSDCILFFRMGDFYEMFYEDAKIAARTMNVALTSRSKERDEPMCGVPYHALTTYLSRMVNAGFKVAICEQVEDPKEAKGLVAREVVRVVTPGTLTEDYLLNEKEANNLVALCEEDGLVGLASVDLSTGTFDAQEFDGEKRFEKVMDELVRLAPKEIVVPDSMKNGSPLAGSLENSDLKLEKFDFVNFDSDEARKRLCELLGVSSLEGFGLANRIAAIGAAGGAVGYIAKQSPGGLSSLTSIRYLHAGEEMEMDAATTRNLELVSNLSDGSRDGTLLEVLDRTKTPMGARLLRNRILKPLKKKETILKRQELVTVFFQNFRESASLQAILERVSDFQRASSRIAGKNFNPRDFSSLKNSVALLPGIIGTVKGLDSGVISDLSARWDNLDELRALLEGAVSDNHPATFKDIGFINEGYSAELDELRSFSQKSADAIKDMEQAEKEKTGISSLKFGYNRIHGYYIEITKKHSGKAPDGWIKKQELLNCERYVSPELKEIEEKLATSEERARTMEAKLVEELRDETLKFLTRIGEAAHMVARLDVAVSLAETARLNNYCKPELTENSELYLEASRHPVIERLMTEENFVPNDVTLGDGGETLKIITGPNMAGKSTYLRQSALAVLMAQMGGYIAATSGVVGIADRIFTRVGAQDRLQKGLSTFMVEMVETANILNNATKSSFIILDEIGRGTSTFDGISIAWAVAEHLAHLKARTLFASHYHELTDMAESMEGVANYNVSAKEYHDRLIFMRKIEKGPADKSYGIQVGRLAGLPPAVLESARRVLADLEKMEFAPDGKPALRVKERSREGKKEKEQISLFDARHHPVIDTLKNTDLDNMTPVEALALIDRLKRLLD
ncbi:MAG: DNA mismatch repair protein MutS [Nitrospinota bacterium]|nr:DNA mismatch repair protein MutS [Nitrospinota bacterium]